MKKFRFFLDFDGTISQGDVVDLILERFGLSQWTDIERLWIEGKIGSRECLSRQMDLVFATEEELKKLLDEVAVDPHFVSFLKQSQNLGVPVAVVSDGFDVVIQHVLKRALQGHAPLLESLQVYSNRLVRTHRGFKALFPEGALCEHACANCKPAVIRKERHAGEQVIFVGDGLSDRFAARDADFTFAKGKLLDFCRKNSIRHREYQSFAQIEEWLSKAIKNAYAVV